jgi:hypothetical protein
MNDTQRCDNILTKLCPRVTLLNQPEPGGTPYFVLVSLPVSIHFIDYNVKWKVLRWVPPIASSSLGIRRPPTTSLLLHRRTRHKKGALARRMHRKARMCHAGFGDAPIGEVNGYG